MDLAWLVTGVALGLLASRVSLMTRRAGAAPAPQDAAMPPAAGAGETSDADAADAADALAEPPASSEHDAGDEGARERVIRLARALGDACEAADRGADLLREPRFAQLTALIGQPPFTAEDRSQWVTSQTTPLACAALAAMAQQGDPGHLGVARTTQRMGYMALHYAFDYLGLTRDPEVAGLLLLNAREWWTEHPGTRAGLLRYLETLRQGGVEPQPPTSAADDWDLEERRSVLRQLAHPLLEGFLARLSEADRALRGRRELDRVARPLADASASPIARSAATDARCEALLEILQREGRPSVVLVGDEGSGKTALAHAALRRLAEAGWHVVEATPAQLMAGQKYIGEIEQRIENFAHGLAGERVLWFVPQCHLLLETGVYSGNARGLLDLLMPHLERHRVQLLGESTPAAWSQVLTQRPRLDALLQSVRIEPLSQADTLALAMDWGRRWAERVGREVLDAALVREAMELARQHAPDRAEPGRCFTLLKEALADAMRSDPPALPLDRDQLLHALSRGSGLPMEILDAGRSFDLDAVKAEFTAAVIGQDEAVECLVDRISMLKAGLTDPRRPVGVFLFAGPTGTGKTELVKALARYLFGNAERMLRIDMSEYQSDDAYWRLLDDARDGRSRSLTSLIRQHPFSVVLLDEFEKAHPRVWDLFLQVFDDGRLTDRSGNVADFRHSIMVLTSNLGATIRRDDGPGFMSRRGGFDRGQVERAIQQSFRPEFVNRIDRVVIFNPLTRSVMRDILEKELRAVLGRRGFRNRDWAVEWEPSAVEFLLERGFTPDLGARPLRRAIDQHLLAPLARTMVEHRVPAGEQFLFVHSDGDALQVRFVDPDAAEPPAAVAEPAASDLRSIALDPRAHPAALRSLETTLAELEAALQHEGWQRLKEQAAQAMQTDGFWQRDDRRDVLDRLERCDRIEDGLRSVRSLHARLTRTGARGGGVLLRRTALQLLGLRQGIDALLHGEPEDAQLEIRPTDARDAASLAWRDRLLQMYRHWATARGMRITPLSTDRDSGSVALTISGGPAFRALLPEVGLHVLDRRERDGDTRCSARVTVRSDPPSAQALPDAGRICRRYDDGPSPLVRDLVRGWRSGRLERVLGGDFDLIDEGA